MKSKTGLIIAIVLIAIVSVIAIKKLKNDRLLNRMRKHFRANSKELKSVKSKGTHSERPKSGNPEPWLLDMDSEWRLQARNKA